LRHRDAAGGRPLLAVLAVWARRRSLRAFLGLLGCLAFTAYNYVNLRVLDPLRAAFLVWVAFLGLSLSALLARWPPRTRPRSRGVWQVR